MMEAAGPYTAEWWNNSRDTYGKIVSHPFNIQLSEGRLSESAFNLYLTQDILYIFEDSRALAATAARAPIQSEMMFLLQMAKDGLDIERLLHDEFLKTFRAEKAEKMIPSIESYASFLVKTAFDGMYEESVAALLPCFWMYREAGLEVVKRSRKGNPYQLWLDTYTGVEFEEMTLDFIVMAEKIAERSNENTRKLMNDAFVQSANHELAFFEEVMLLSSK